MQSLMRHGGASEGLRQRLDQTGHAAHACKPLAIARHAGLQSVSSACPLVMLCHVRVHQRCIHMSFILCTCTTVGCVCRRVLHHPSVWHAGSMGPRLQTQRTNAAGQLATGSPGLHLCYCCNKPTHALVNHPALHTSATHPGSGCNSMSCTAGRALRAVTTGWQDA
jgi:hypothetical protein